jgi:hypothetical protein
MPSLCVSPAPFFVLSQGSKIIERALPCEPATGRWIEPLALGVAAAEEGKAPERRRPLATLQRGQRCLGISIYRRLYDHVPRSRRHGRR